MMHATHHRHRAVTLLELTASMAIATVLMAGLTSAVVLASRAMPASDGPVSATLDGYHVAEQIAGDLFCAQSFTVNTATAVEFTVADRDKDSNPETIRYEWSGIPGDPLTRQYNGNTALELLPEVNEFGLTYSAKTVTETSISSDPQWTPEAAVASFDGWSGITATTKTNLLGPSDMSSEYFEITPPDGATQLKITRATVVLSHLGTPPQGVIVGVHRSKNDGSYEPESVTIGTAVTIPGSSLSTTAFWHQASFSDVLISDVARTDYCLTIAVVGTTPAYVSYLNAKSAPNDGMFMRWTTDGGGSWDPRNSQINQNDVRFVLYGSFSVISSEPVTVEKSLLASVRINLHVGSGESCYVETTVPILNLPEAATP